MMSKGCVFGTKERHFCLLNNGRPTCLQIAQPMKSTNAPSLAFKSRIFRPESVYFYSMFTWPCIVTNLFLIKQTDALISQMYFVKKLYTFRAVPLPIIRSFPLYLRHWCMSCKFDDSFQARPSWSCLKAVIDAKCSHNHFSSEKYRIMQ